MPLPDLIEIVPPEKPLRAEITVPGSKSITNRALILAALADGRTTLRGALWSEDTQIMVEGLQKLGFVVSAAPGPDEVCNRTLTVHGQGGVIPPGGTAARPLELLVGNAGTAARFLAALVCLGKGVYRLHGVPRMHERPQAALFRALRELGYRVDSPNDKLPATFFGGGSRREAALLEKSPMTDQSLSGVAGSAAARRCTVSIAESSQFASALLLCAGAGGWHVNVTGENAEESPYVAMTSKLIEAFPNRGGTLTIEPDASGGSYFWAAGRLRMEEQTASPQERGFTLNWVCAPTVTVAGWPASRWQADERFLFFFSQLEMRSRRFADATRGTGPAALAGRAASPPVGAPSLAISRRSDLGDSIMTAIVISPLLIEPVRFTDLGRLRVQECERVFALRTELTRCGAKVIEDDDTLTVYPSKLHGAEIETYNDHRMAMCFSILGLKVPGIKIKNPACVKKTFPNFFQKLAAPPPKGLGATILDVKTGRKLGVEELFEE